MNAHDFNFTSIDGTPLPMASFKGKAVLVVNTASECGLTPQYAGLEDIHREFGPRGLVVLGVPCNDFGGQEPGSEAQIAAFCERKFQVTFPMTSKVHVTGKECHPFFAWARMTLGEEAAPTWNFHKYLVGPEGDLIGAIGSAVKPTDDEALQAIEDALPG